MIPKPPVKMPGKMPPKPMVGNMGRSGPAPVMRRFGSSAKPVPISASAVARAKRTAAKLYEDGSVGKPGPRKAR